MTTDFPFTALESSSDIFSFVDSEIKKLEPNLVLLSLVLGSVEDGVCSPVARMARKRDIAVEPMRDHHSFNGVLPIRSQTIELPYRQFLFELRTATNEVELRNDDGSARRTAIKFVSDWVWKRLSKAFSKDKPHVQTIYSFMTGKHLDCFGLALTVVAACQELGLSDVHLALSEDHAWITFGLEGTETAEVTWHGKGNEQKRGQPIELPSGSWLYLNGHPVICNRHMEVAAIVNMINPKYDGKREDADLGRLQQDLLWLLFDAKHLDKYPMGLATLAEYEEFDSSEGRPSPDEIFDLAIRSSLCHYENALVYPHTLFGSYLYRSSKYKAALQRWKDAAQVLKHYPYSKGDEEIFKELREIVTDFIPDMMADGVDDLATDPHFFALLLTFYDELCLWETAGPMPILHSDWAKGLVSTVKRFNGETRKTSATCPVQTLVGSSYMAEPFCLKSEKMKGLLHTLTVADKVNLNAVRLQLTALPRGIAVATTESQSRKRRHNSSV